MNAARIAWVALVSSVIVHLASYVPVPSWPGGALVTLGIPDLLAFPLHLSAVVMFPFAAYRLWRGDVRPYDFWDALSIRDVLIALGVVAYLAVAFRACVAAMESPVLSSNAELRLELRLFSGAWIFVLGAAWSVLRCAGAQSQLAPASE